jgi:hypothetical protein
MLVFLIYRNRNSEEEHSHSGLQERKEAFYPQISYYEKYHLDQMTIAYPISRMKYIGLELDRQTIPEDDVCDLRPGYTTVQTYYTSRAVRTPQGPMAQCLR